MVAWNEKKKKRKKENNNLTKSTMYNNSNNVYRQWLKVGDKNTMLENS